MTHVPRMYSPVRIQGKSQCISTISSSCWEMSIGLLYRSPLRSPSQGHFAPPESHPLCLLPCRWYLFPEWCRQYRYYLSLGAVVSNKLGQSSSSSISSKWFLTFLLCFLTSFLSSFISSSYLWYRSSQPSLCSQGLAGILNSVLLDMVKYKYNSIIKTELLACNT